MFGISEQPSLTVSSIGRRPVTRPVKAGRIRQTNGRRIWWFIICTIFGFSDTTRVKDQKRRNVKDIRLLKSFSYERENAGIINFEHLGSLLIIPNPSHFLVPVRHVHQAVDFLRLFDCRWGFITVPRRRLKLQPTRCKAACLRDALAQEQAEEARHKD